MAVISYNLGELQNLLATVDRRNSDLRDAAAQLRSVGHSLQLDPADPNARGVHQRLDQIGRSLSTVTNRLDTHHGRTRTFVARAATLDRPTVIGRRLPLLPVAWPGRLRVWPSPPPGLWRVLPTPIWPPHRSPVGGLWPRFPELPSPRLWPIGLVPGRPWDPTRWSPVPMVLQLPASIARGALPTTMLGRPLDWGRVSVRFRASAVDAARWTGRNADRYVIQPAARLGRQVYDWALRRGEDAVRAFDAAFDAIWAQYQQTVALARTAVEAVPAIWTTRFVTPPRHPDAVKTESLHVDGTLTVDIPIKGIPLRLEFAASAEVVYFSDGTADITLGSEFAAGLAAKLAAETGGNSAKIEAAIMRAIGGETTFRITARPGDNQHELFLAQFAARMGLTSLAAGTNGPVVALAAAMALKSMAPMPTPVSSSVYTKVTAELSADVDSLAFGASGKAKTELEGRITRTEAGTTVFEASALVEASTAARLAFVGVAGANDGKVSFRVEVDASGRPIAIEMAFETKAEVDGTVGTSDIGAQIGTVQVTTMTRRIEIDAVRRQRFAALMADLPRSGSVLIAELQSLAGSGALSVEHERYDYARGEVSYEVGGGKGAGVELGGSIEERRYQR